MGLSRTDIAALAVTIILIGAGALAFHLSERPVKPAKRASTIELSPTAMSAATKACRGSFVALSPPSVKENREQVLTPETSFMVRCQDGRELEVLYRPQMGVDIQM